MNSVHALQNDSPMFMIFLMLNVFTKWMTLLMKEKMILEMCCFLIPSTIPVVFTQLYCFVQKPKKVIQWTINQNLSCLNYCYSSINCMN